MGRFVSVAQTPKSGKEPRLIAAAKKHPDVLRVEAPITDKGRLRSACGRLRIPAISGQRSDE